MLFKLHNSLFNERELEEFLHRQTYSNSDTVISRIHTPSEILELIESNKTFEDRLYITDILSENTEVCNIIDKESLGSLIFNYKHPEYDVDGKYSPWERDVANYTIKSHYITLHEESGTYYAFV